MKNIPWFYIGVGIDAFALLLALTNFFAMRNAGDGLAPAGRIAVVAIPLLLLALIGAAFWLRANGKIQLANILVWIPALPIAGVVVLWGGLALVFALFGK
ncbi:MAG: hypothetical protein L6Q97_27445 [Thermoanaerobaculia bacterium]|nr:hypothetical protein [Thermoanaerobaculia bacterium]